jgi:protoporphyrinogen oxidase
MPIKDLIRAMTPQPPEEIREISEGLVYRDFVTVGLLLDTLSIGKVGDSGTVKDNWIYIHDPAVEAGRLQIFNNWSPYLVQDPGKAWIGVEYFCDEGDRIWSRSDAEMVAHSLGELRTIHLTEEREPRDSVVIRMKKAYPAYRGTYGRFDDLRRHLDSVENLYLIGRNGMHRYNNQDHSMLTAMTVVDNLVDGRRDRSNVWNVNAEEDYHEAKAADKDRLHRPEPESEPERDREEMKV